MRRDIWPTPEDKEAMARTIGATNPAQAAEWMALAALQRAESLSAYREALERWEAAKPRPEDFLGDDSRGRIVRFRDELREQARAETERIWGSRIVHLEPGDYPLVKSRSR